MKPTLKEQVANVHDGLEDLMIRIFQRSEQSENRFTDLYRVHALVADSRALVAGMMDGEIRSGQERIYKNLILSTDLLGKNDERLLALQASQLLERATYAGLTIEGHSLFATRTMGNLDR